MADNFDKQILIRLGDGDDTELILMKDGTVIVGTEGGYFLKDEFMIYLSGEAFAGESHPQPWQAWQSYFCSRTQVNPLAHIRGSGVISK